MVPLVGHVHLHTSDLDAAQAFYHDVLGFDVTLRSEDFQAVFVSAGGYHHHLGLNVWIGVAAPSAPPNSIGLRDYTIALPGERALQAVVGRAQRAGFSIDTSSDGYVLTDPAGVGVRLAVA